MKKLLITIILFILVCSFAFTDDGVYISPGIGFWKSNILTSYSEVAAADYQEVSDATVNIDGSSIVPLATAAVLEAGYHLDELSIFLKYAIASESVRLDSNAASSETYYNSETSSYSSYTDYDRTSGSIWEMNLTLNASYDFLLTKTKEEGFSFYLTAGGGVDWLFSDNNFGFYELGSWQDYYSGSGSPSASTTKTASFDVAVPTIVPIAEAGTGFRYYIDKLNSVSAGVLVTCYILPRISDNVSYIQDSNGNALELIFKSKNFAPRFYISYGLNR